VTQQGDTLFGREISLVVYNAPSYSTTSPSSPSTGSSLTSTPGSAPQNGLDLSNMRIHFKVNQSDIETPNNALIRVYNLSDTTQKKVQGEFQRVMLQAGYQSNYGVIFDGTIKQVMSGHESNIDSYVDIFAADGDIPYNNGVVNTALVAGSTKAQQLNALAQAMGLPKGYVMDLPVSALARGKVMFGLARDRMRDLADTVSARWSIQNGQLTLIPLAGYQPGEAVVLNSATGMIGFPQQTPGGIEVTCLINPKIKIGTLVQINNKSINQGVSQASGSLLYNPGRLENLPGYLAKISDDGLYKVLVHEFEGDTRANEWYSHLICLALDQSAPSGSQVKPYWAGGPT
jgi:hypothetical protein